MSNSMDAVCRWCGLRFGEHSGLGQQCPAALGDYNYAHGPGTIFESSGVNRTRDSYPRGTRAVNLPRVSSLESMINHYAEVCVRCGNTRGAHSTDVLTGRVRCPARSGETGASSREGVFTPALEPRPTYEASRLSLTDVCARCGREYGAHRGLNCPDGQGTFTLLRSDSIGISSISISPPMVEGEGGTTGVSGPRNPMICVHCGESRGRHRAGETESCPNAEGSGWAATTFLASAVLPVPTPTAEEEETTEVSRSEPHGDGWIMVAGGEDKLQRLCAAGITASIAVIVSPFEFRGIVFPEAQLEAVKGLRVVAVHPTLVPTSTEGLRLSLSRGDIARLAEIEKARAEEEAKMATATKEAEKKGEYKVIKESISSLEYWNEMEPVLQKYAKKLKKSISVFNAHGTQWAWTVVPANTLRIVFWAIIGEVGGGTYRRIFGIGLTDGQTDGTGATLGAADYDITDNDGKIAAQISGNTMTIPFDLPHGPLAGKLLECILEKYSALGLDTLEERGDEQKVMLISKIMTISMDRLIATHKSALASNMSNINDYSSAISTQLAQAATHKQTLQALIEKKERLEDEGIKILGSLRKMDKVKDIDVRGDMLVVSTEHLDFTYKGKTYKGHSYAINLCPARGTMQIMSNDGGALVDGRYFHPHINHTGIPCMGNIKKGAYDFMTGFEFVPLVDLLIQYLQVANDTDWYLDPVKWPLVKETGKEEKKEKVAEAAVPVAAAQEPVTYHCGGCGHDVAEADWCDGCGYCNDCCGCDNEDDYDDEEDDI